MKTITRLVLAAAAASVTVASSDVSTAAAGTTSLLNASYVHVAFGQPRASIEGYSKTTLQYLANHPSWRDPGYLKNAIPAVAQWDYYHNTTTFKTYVTEQNEHYVDNPGPCHSYWNTPMVNKFNDYPSWTALGVLEQWKAYGPNDTLLEQIKEEFDFITQHGYITKADLKAGYLVGTKPKNNTLKAVCNGQSMLGGVYWENGCPGNEAALADTNIPTVSTALYALVGASLCRQTKNNTYCSQAYSSMQWIDRHLRRSDDLIDDQIDGSTCEVKPWKPFTYNSALYIAAYADLANITSNATALALARSTALASMRTSYWNTARGILSEGAGSDLNSDDFIISFGPTLIRFLQQSYNHFDVAMQAAILRYINIQYWAITQLDSDSPTHPHLYGRNWTGPAYESATNYTIAQATYVLNGISLNQASSFPTVANASAPVAHLVS